MSFRRAHIRYVLPLAIALTTAGAFYLVFRRTGAGVVHVAARPNWFLLGAAFVVWAGVQPLRAWAWSSTLRAPCGFRAVYAASAIGSFLDTVLPGRLGEGSKVAVLRVSAGSRWPGFSRAGGSLLCAHLVEMVAFALLGALSAFFLPLPGWRGRRSSSGCRSPRPGFCSRSRSTSTSATAFREGWGRSSPAPRRRLGSCSAPG